MITKLRKFIHAIGKPVRWFEHRFWLWSVDRAMVKALKVKDTRAPAVVGGGSAEDLRESTPLKITQQELSETVEKMLRGDADPGRVLKGVRIVYLYEDGEHIVYEQEGKFQSALSFPAVGGCELVLTPMVGHDPKPDGKNGRGANEVTI